MYRRSDLKGDYTKLEAVVGLRGASLRGEEEVLPVVVLGSSVPAQLGEDLVMEGTRRGHRVEVHIFDSKVDSRLTPDNVAFTSWLVEELAQQRFRGVLLGSSPPSQQPERPMVGAVAQFLAVAAQRLAFLDRQLAFWLLGKLSLPAGACPSCPPSRDHSRFRSASGSRSGA